MNAVATAEAMNTTGQDVTCVMKLAIGRDSMMPSISPLVTVPTTRPRVASGARWAAKGSSICTTTALDPITSIAARNGSVWRAKAAPSSASAHRPSTDDIRRRFSTMSPSGTMKRRPST